MEIKKAQRRDAIMQVAIRMFREVGFEATSMSQIAKRVGGSKGTLYNYFSSKEELLLAAMLDEAQKSAAIFEAALNQSGELATRLTRFVRSWLEILQTDDTIKIIRVAISVSTTTDIGSQFYDLAILDFRNQLAQMLADSVQQGKLKDEDPYQMARLLHGLCEMELVPALMGVPVLLSDADLDKEAKAIVEVFLRAYGA